MNYTQLATKSVLQKTIDSLEANGFSAILAKDKEEAKNLALNLIPKGSYVMENTSQTLDDIGVRKEIETSQKYTSVHTLSRTIDRAKFGKKIKKLRSVPDVAIGSFHAVTQDGHIMIASGSGSQIPGYAYGAEKVIFVAGTHKIVRDLNAGMRRIYEHSLPLESKRIGGSNVRKILIINSEKTPGKITIIFINEALGF